MPGAHNIEREYFVISKLHAVGFPVPKPVLLCKDETIIGQKFYMMEYVKGRIFRDKSLPGISPPERMEIMKELNRVLA